MRGRTARFGQPETSAERSRNPPTRLSAASGGAGASPLRRSRSTFAASSAASCSSPCVMSWKNVSRLDSMPMLSAPSSSAPIQLRSR